MGGNESIWGQKIVGGEWSGGIKDESKADPKIVIRKGFFIVS